MDPIYVLRGDSLIWTVTFWLDAGRTQPWNDLADFSPRVQVRPDTEATTAITPELTVVENVVWLKVPAATAASMKPGTSYVWDVQLTDPEAPAGYGEFSWPPHPDPRGTIDVGADVTRIAA